MSGRRLFQERFCQQSYMLGRFYFLQDTNDSEVRSDHKGSPFGTEIFLSVHALFDPNAIALNHVFVRIAQQRERQSMLLDELLMTGCGIDAYAEKLRPGLNFAPSISKIARLPRASGRVILRIKVKNQHRSFEIVQFHRLSGSINATDSYRLKSRGSITNFQLHIHRNKWRKFSRLRALRNPLHRAFSGDFAGREATLE